MTLKSFLLQLPYVALFTLAFLFESALTLATVGFYIVFMPDNKLLMHKVNLWGMRTQLKYRLRNSTDPHVHELIDKIR